MDQKQDSKLGKLKQNKPMKQIRPFDNPYKDAVRIKPEEISVLEKENKEKYPDNKINVFGFNLDLLEVAVRGSINKYIESLKNKIILTLDSKFNRRLLKKRWSSFVRRDSEYYNASFLDKVNPQETIVILYMSKFKYHERNQIIINQLFGDGFDNIYVTGKNLSPPNSPKSSKSNNINKLKNDSLNDSTDSIGLTVDLDISIPEDVPPIMIPHENISYGIGPPIFNLIDTINGTNIYVGGEKTLTDEDISFDAIINCTTHISNHDPVKYNDGNYMKMGWEDAFFQELDGMEEALQFLDEKVNDDSIKNVLIHCQMGISRSASVMIAYLIAKNSATYEEAYDFVQEKRPCIRPNSGFCNYLRSMKFRLN